MNNCEAPLSICFVSVVVSMEDTILLIGLTVLVIVLFAVLLLFKRSNAKPTPAVRPLKREEESVVTPSKKRDKQEARDRSQLKKRTNKKKKRELATVVEPDKVVEEIAEPFITEKPIETITESLFEQYYYDTPFDKLEPQPKGGNMEYNVRLLFFLYFFPLTV